MTTILTAARVPFLLALCVWLAALAIGPGLGLSARFEYPYLDWNLRSLAAHHPPDPDIALLDIDEPTLEAMEPEYGRYPWSRAVYGELIENLARQKPAAIVFDILITDPQKEHAQDDSYLIRAAQRSANVYFPMVRLPGGAKADDQGFLLQNLPGIERAPDARKDARAAVLLPLTGLFATGRIGAIDVVADEDAKIRRYPLYRDAYGWHIPSLPARVAKDLGYAIPEGETLPLVWHGPARSYRTVSFHEVYADFARRQPKRPPDEFRNKIVVIGGSAAGLVDLRATPMHPDFPGPEIIATALDNLKNGERLKFAPRGSGLLLTALMLAGLAGSVTLGMSVIRLGVLTLALTAALGVGTWASVVYGRYAVPVVMPILFGGWFYYLLAALRAWLLEQRGRQRVTQMFSRFLDPRVVADLVSHGNAEAAMASQKRDITVLFSDIRGFTTLSEQKTPEEIVELLNHYFRLQVEVIFRHAGTLDKYIGDAIMAFWGAPKDQPDHARRALEAARDMEKALAQFKAELGPSAKDFDIGIGLNSGVAVVGIIGSREHRQDYTVIGDTVNTASRIEGATKGRARILVSDATRGAVGDSFKFCDHGWVALKGKEEKVRLFEPIF